MDFGQLPSDDINALLEKQTFGHLGCCLNDKPYVFPMAYAYRDNVIYGQTTTGRKVEIMRQNPNVCFQVGLVHPHGWESVMCWGSFQELAFKDLKDGASMKAVKLLTKHIGSIQNQIGLSVPFSFENGAEPVKVNDKESTLFRIVINEKTGKRYGERR